MVDMATKLAKVGTGTSAVAARSRSNFDSHHLPIKPKDFMPANKSRILSTVLAKTRTQAPINTSRTSSARAMKYRSAKAPSFNPYQRQLLNVKSFIANINTLAKLKEVDSRNLDSAFISAISAVKTLPEDGAKGEKTLLKKAFKDAVIRQFIKYQKLLGPNRVRQTASNLERSFNVTLTKKES